MSQASPNVGSRRLFLRSGGAAALPDAAVVLLASREALAQSATLAQANLDDSPQSNFEPSAIAVSAADGSTPAIYNKRGRHEAN